MEKIFYVEMGVHKESIALIVAADEEVRSIGCNTSQTFKQWQDFLFCV